MKHLQDTSLIVCQDNCIFSITSVEFLSGKISPFGVTPLPNKVEVISKFDFTSIIKSLREFIGMVNYYCRLLPKIVDIMELLSTSLIAKPKKLEWGPKQQKAFEDSELALTSATTLTPLLLSSSHSHYRCQFYRTRGGPLANTHGYCTATGILHQKTPASRKTILHFRRELLAVDLVTRHFRHLLEGTIFTIRTNHELLVCSFFRSGET